MSQWTKSREKKQELNSLVLIPHILLNQNIIVDLRNETWTVGTLDKVDGFMNITLKDSVLCDQKNQQYAFEMFHIPARMIRYIHIPENIHIKQEINKYLCKKSKKPIEKLKSFKMKRAQQNQKEILHELAMSQKLKNKEGSME